MVHCVIIWYIESHYGKLCHPMVHYVILWNTVSYYGTGGSTIFQSVLACVYTDVNLKVFKMLYHVIPFGLKTPRNMINITIINSTILTKSSVEVLSVTYLKEMQRLVRLYLLLQDKSIATITSQVKYQSK